MQINLCGQCVSLIQQYINKCYGIPYRARGNAIDWQVNPLKNNGFTKASGTIKKGDILVYKTSTRFGHIALVDADGDILDQNRGGNRVVVKSKTISSGYNRVAILRPPKVDLGTSSGVGASNKVKELQKALKIVSDGIYRCSNRKSGN